MKERSDISGKTNRYKRLAFWKISCYGIGSRGIKKKFS